MRIGPVSLAVVLGLTGVAGAGEDAPPPAGPSTAQTIAPARILTIDGRVLEGRSIIPRGTALELEAKGGPLLVDLAEVLEAAPAGAPAVREAPTAANTLPVEVELVNGDLLRGVLLKGLGEKGFLVRSAALGEVEVALESVAAVRFPASYAKTEDPQALKASEKADRFLFLTGDRLDGTLRSAGPEGVRVRTSGGEDRVLAPGDLLGFILLPFAKKEEKGMALRLALVEGTRISGTEVRDEGGGWILKGTADGKERHIPGAAVAGIAVRGGRGTPLSDLVPASVEVKPYWGDDTPVLALRPVVDRAFTLDHGPAPPLRLGGRTYLRGLSMFSGMTVTYDIGTRGFKSFQTAVGVDDAGPMGAVEFEVLVDGKSAWRSGVVKTVPRGGEPALAPKIDVTGAKKVSLVVHAGPGDDVQDFADWVRAAFLP